MFDVAECGALMIDLRVRYAWRARHRLTYRHEGLTQEGSLTLTRRQKGTVRTVD